MLKTSALDCLFVSSKKQMKIFLFWGKAKEKFVWKFETRLFMTRPTKSCAGSHKRENSWAVRWTSDASLLMARWTVDVIYLFSFSPHFECILVFVFSKKKKKRKRLRFVWVYTSLISMYRPIPCVSTGWCEIPSCGPCYLLRLSIAPFKNKKHILMTEHETRKKKKKNSVDDKSLME